MKLGYKSAVNLGTDSFERLKWVGNTRYRNGVIIYAFCVSFNFSASNRNHQSEKEYDDWFLALNGGHANEVLVPK